MTGNHFTEDDKNKLIDLLNMVATKASFTVDTKEAIEYVKLLGHVQKVILPKINEHILELKHVKHNESTPNEDNS